MNDRAQHVMCVERTSLSRHMVVDWLLCKQRVESKLDWRKLPLAVDSDDWTFLAGLSAPGRSHEEVAVHRITDRCDPEGGGSWRYCGAVDSQARHQRGNL